MNSLPMMITVAASAVALAGSPDPLAPRPTGMAHARPTRHILIGGTVHTAPSAKPFPSSSTPAIVIEDGLITQVYDDTRLIDLKSNGYQIHHLDPDAHIYAGFIDSYVPIELSPPPAGAPGTHWNSFVAPQRDALETGLPTDTASDLRELGFTTAMIAPDHGVFRGWSAIVSTAEPFSEPSMGTTPIHKAHAAQLHGFDKTGWQDAAYPTSHMGIMALLRQTFIDAEHRNADKYAPDHNDNSCLDHVSTENLNIFDTDHELEALLAAKVAKDFDHDRTIIVGNGAEHRRLEAFMDMGYPVIVPLNFPKTPNVFSIGAADSVDLAALQSWERAPANARWLANSGLDVALTSSKLPEGQDFWDNLHTAIEKGLEPSAALAMLTTNPAEILGLQNHAMIRKSSHANLVIADADLFDPAADAKIIDLFIDGRPHHINDTENTRFDGTWSYQPVNGWIAAPVTISAGSLTLHDDDIDHKARKVTIDGNSISFIFDVDGESFLHSGTLGPDNTIRGTVIMPDQSVFQWFAPREADRATAKDFAGTWDAKLNNRFALTFKVDGDKVTVIEHTKNDDITQAAIEIRIEDNQLKFNFEHKPFGMEGVFRVALTPPTGDALTGDGEMPGGKAFPLTAVRATKDAAETEHLPDLPTAPFGPYAYTEPLNAGITLLTNATIWTQADEGILEDGWIILRDNKIMSLGTGGIPRIAIDRTIDAEGLHITPGLIDAHSHTGLFRFGVNESGQAVTSEVRIADSLDPAHPGFYRELAGGLTTAMLLHGSANPIGGQSQTIKLRWGSDKPEDMHFEGAKPGIKFALGENVKQSNWGDKHTTRYPQTRMGVETLMRDRFTRAREYDAEMKRRTDIVTMRENDTLPQPGIGDPISEIRAYNELMRMTPPARDLELEALAQILAGERLVHSHSYRQDEILMLCRIAEEFDFTIGTFQHGLETYKVAEIVKEHAIGTSIFSDWGAYKAEVQDAIPYAGPINHEVGLLTSYNSDSDDVARRMHVEAGKAYKYAKMSGIEMSQQDALNFVTRNPAIQLGILDRVGTLEPGKDADLAIWTGNPLSSLSRCEMTFVDGKLMFSRELDAEMRQTIAAERQRIIQMILSKGIKANKEVADDKADEHDHPEYTTSDSNSEQGTCGCTVHTSN